MKLDSSGTELSTDPEKATTAAATSNANKAPTVTPSIRTSARVQLRKREELEVKTAAAPQADTDDQQGQDGNKGQAHQELGGGDESTFKGRGGESGGERPPTKKRRTWEQWSSEDKSLFFEALNECGKNFDAIHQFIQAKKMRKKGGGSDTVSLSAGANGINSGGLSSAFKAKEQIRTFYYRTWHKISKYIEFPPEMGVSLKKSCCELYGLINFGELRKKTGSKLNEKTGVKLQQLVFEGHTTVRVRGKSHRIKTPMCSTLVKLKNEEAARGRLGSAAGGSGGGGGGGGSGSSGNPACVAMRATSLPGKVSLVLEPGDREAFTRVHKLAFQNPRLTLSVGLDKRLSSVLSYLDKKWAAADKVICDKFKDFVSPSFLTKSAAVKKCCHQEEDLWLVPKPGTKLMSPLLKPIEPLTSSTLSLSHLQTSNKTEPTTAEPAATASTSTAAAAHDHMNGILSDSKSEISPTAKTASGVGAPPGDQADTGVTSSSTSAPSAAAAAIETSEDEKEEKKKQELLLGWNSEKSRELTVGEMFLINGLGNLVTSSIQLDYCWRKRQPVHSSSQSPACSCDLPKKAATPSILQSLSKLTASELAKRSKPNNSQLVSTKLVIKQDMSEASTSDKKPMVVIKQQPGESSAVVTNCDQLPTIQTNWSSVVGNGVNVSPPAAAAASSSPPTATSQESVNFRRPAMPPPPPPTMTRRFNPQTSSNNSAQQAFKQQLDLLIPKYNQRKGRPLMRSKSVVSRQLLSTTTAAAAAAPNHRPLQPKMHPLIKTVDGKVKVRCFPESMSNVKNPPTAANSNNTQPPPPPTITLTHPVISIGQKPNHGLVNHQQQQQRTIQLSPVSSISHHRLMPSAAAAAAGVAKSPAPHRRDMASSPTRAAPPPPTPPSAQHRGFESTPKRTSGGGSEFHAMLSESGGQSNDGFSMDMMDCSMSNGGGGGDAGPSSKGVVRSDKILFDTVIETSNCSMLQTPPVHRPTPPPSPFNGGGVGGGTGDDSWMPEISLNSLLNISSSGGGVGSRSATPSLMMRSNTPVHHLINEDSSQSTGSEVDRHILSMMTESSVDFTSKFARLANAVNSSGNAATVVNGHDDIRNEEEEEQVDGHWGDFLDPLWSNF